MKTLKITLLAAVLLITATAFKCDKKNDGIYRGRVSEAKKLVTPKGATVYSAKAIDPRFGQWVDEGLGNLFRIARLSIANYPANDRYNQYSIWLIEASPRCSQPAFLVETTDPTWDGTEYDKDPEQGRVLLCAAGMMMRRGQGMTSTGILGTPGMIIADKPGIVPTIVRFEGEHNELLDFSREWYARTQNIHAHPLMPDPETGSLMSSDIVKSATIRLDKGYVAEDQNGNPIAAAKNGDVLCVLITK